MTTKEVAQKLVELCSAGQWDEAVRQLYADDAVQIEAAAYPGMESPITRGKEKLLAMSAEFNKMMTVHGQEIGQPLVNHEQFLCTMSIDVTPTGGPMAGKRHTMSETCLYTVKDGKIAEARFFYPT